MAYRNITVFIKANATGFGKGLDKAAAELRKFNTGLGGVASNSKKAISANQQMTKSSLGVARGMGVAASKVDRMSGSLRRGGLIAQAMAAQVGILNKGFAAMKVIALQAITALGGFIAIHTIIRTASTALHAAIDAWKGFDEAMVNSLAIMGDVSVALREDMADAAREMAMVSTFSATEVAEAYFYLASAGLNAAQSLGVLDQAVTFAQAGNFDLAQATDLLTDAQSAMGLVVRDAAGNILASYEDASGAMTGFAEQNKRVSDVLVKANTLANATVEQFSQALTTKAAAAARQFGISIEETTSVLAVFADQGLKGQAAGTAFSMMLRDLTTKAIRNGDAFEAMGIEVFDSSGEFTSFASIIGQMEQAFSGMSDEQRRASLLQLGFTDRSVAATSALIGTSSQISRYNEGLNDAAGITEEVAQNQLESFAAKLELVKSRLLDVAINAGQRFNEFLNDNSERFNELGSSITSAVQSIGSAVGNIAGPISRIVGLLTGGTFSVFATSLSTAAKAMERFQILGALVASLLLTRMAAGFGSFVRGTTSAKRVTRAYNANLRANARQLVAYGKNLDQMTFRQQMMTTATTHARTAMRTFGQVADKAFKKIKSFAVSAAPVLILTAILNWGSAMRQAREEADAFVDTLKDDIDKSSMESYAEGVNEMIRQQEEARDAINEHRSGLLGLGRSLKTGAGDLLGMNTEGRNLMATYESLSHALESEVKPEHQTFITMVDNLANSLGVTNEEVVRAANALEIDLSQGMDVGIDSLRDLSDNIRVTRMELENAGVDISSLGEVSDEEFTEIADNAAEAQEDFRKAITRMISTAGAFERSLTDLGSAGDVLDDIRDSIQEESDLNFDDTVESMREGIEDMSDLRDDELDNQSDAIEDMREARQREIEIAREAGQDEIEARRDAAGEMEDLSDDEQDALDNEIEAMEDSLDARIQSMEDALDDQKDVWEEEVEGTKDSWDDRIEAERDGIDRMQRERDNAPPPAVSARDILDDMISTQEGAETFSRTLTAIYREGLSKFASGSSEMDAVNGAIEFLRQLGIEEGSPLAQEILADVEGFVNDYNGVLTNIGEGENMTANFEEFLLQLRQQRDQFLSETSALVTVSGRAGEFGFSYDQIREIYSDNPDIINSIAQAINSGEDELVAQAFDTLSDRLDEETQQRHAELLGQLANLVAAAATDATDEADTELRNFLEEHNDELQDMVLEIDATTAEAFSTEVIRHLNALDLVVQEKIASLGTALGWFSFRDEEGNYSTTPERVDSNRELLEQAQQREEFLAAWQQAEMMRADANADGLITQREVRDAIAAGVLPESVMSAWNVNSWDGPVVIRQFASGGFESHNADMVHSARLFGERETGGEAYIPMARHKRNQSVGILSQVAREFGFGLTSTPGSSMTRSGGASPDIQVLPIEVPVSKTTQYQFGDVTAADPAATIAFAHRKARQRNLTGSLRS